MRVKRTGGWRGRVRLLVIDFAFLATPIGITMASSSAAARAQQERVNAAVALAGDAFVAEAAQRFGLPAAWIRAVIDIESHGDPRAVSPAGAMGLMQIMPDTWAAERTRLRLGRDPFDVRDNIFAGADFLRAMRDRYGVIGMLAAYNAGPGRYEDFRRRGRRLPAETLAYVARLAPVVVDGASVIDPRLTPPDPLAWTHAALFASRSAASLRAQPAFVAAPAAAQSASTQPARVETAEQRTIGNRSAARMARTDLFVPLTGPQS